MSPNYNPNGGPIYIGCSPRAGCFLRKSHDSPLSPPPLPTLTSPTIDSLDGGDSGGGGDGDDYGG